MNEKLLEYFKSDDIHLIQCEHKWCDTYGYKKSQMKKDLLDYITNLQQDLDKANEIIEKDRQFNQGRLLDVAKLKEENERLKYWLNDVIFNEKNIDVELPARYLRKLGYIDFDDENKVYINKHNNNPFMQEDSKEKAFYLKDEELSEYTKQLESQNENYKSRCEKVKEYIKKLQENDDIEIWRENGYWAYILNILNGENND